MTRHEEIKKAIENCTHMLGYKDGEKYIISLLDFVDEEFNAKYDKYIIATKNEVIVASPKEIEKYIRLELLVDFWVDENVELFGATIDEEMTLTPIKRNQVLDENLKAVYELYIIYDKNDKAYGYNDKEIESFAKMWN